MRAHVIENGVIVNTILVESLDVLPNLVEATEGDIGWYYNDGVASPPPRDIDAEWKVVLARRDALLTASNNHVTPDLWEAMSEQDKQVWTLYRQFLRDVEKNFTDPSEVVWLPDPAATPTTNGIGVTHV